MPLLLAALLAAGEPSAEFSFSAAAGNRGERRAEATARASSGTLALTLGAADLEGPEASRRQELTLGAEAGVFRGNARFVPGTAGLTRVAAEAGVHFESLSLVLGARTGALGAVRLRGAGLRVELEGELADDLCAGLGASAWALQLDAPSPREAWAAWGMKTLDWAQRWEVGGWMSRQVAELFSFTPSLSIAEAAEPGVFEARGSIAFEVPLGSVKLRAEPAIARQWPELWMLDLSVGVTMKLY